MENKTKEVYKYFKQKRKKLFIKTAILALLFLGINAYAWFIYIDQFSGSIDVSVISWDVTFYDEDTTLERVSLTVNDLYPGMPVYSKDIRVNNDSDLVATFNYNINSFSILGTTYTVDNINLTNGEAVAFLASSLPFAITFSASKNELASNGDNLIFNVQANWPFEAEEPYYKLHSFFIYDATIKYYTLVDGEYIEDTEVTAENIATKIASDLYVESDDADTFWGTQAAIYKQIDPEAPCVTLDLELVVSQKQGS